MRFLKSSWFLVVCFFCSFLSFGQKSTEVEITGTVKGNYIGKMFLFFEDHYRQKDSISSEIKDGKFYFKCHVPVPVLGRIHLGDNSLIGDFYIDKKQVFLTCTNKITTINTGKDTMNILSIDVVAGSKMEEIKNKFLQSIHVTNPGEIYKLDTLGYYEKISSFVKQNAKNKISPYLISFCDNLSYYQIRSLYNLLDTSLNNTYEGRSAGKLMNLKERAVLELFNEGKPFHDITLPDHNGREINTRQLNGNYFLIICWASWCAPCRNESPALRDLFNKYKERGLTMVGVSFDQSKEKWMDAIRKDNLLWAQLIDADSYNGDLAKYYGIEGIPIMFLLDKDRKIIVAGSIDAIGKRIEDIPWPG